MDYDELYQEMIRDHYKHPRNKENLAGREDIPVLDNPSCGDTVQLGVLWSDDDKVEKVFFDGHGCSISMASASMLTEILEGQSAEEAQKTLDTFLAIFRGEQSSDDLEEMGDLMALKGVIGLPVRIKCATLAWHALEAALIRYREKQN